MTQKMSYIEKMEYLYVLNETKKLLHQKIETTVDQQQLDLMDDDMSKIERELQAITGDNPEVILNDTLNIVFPYYEIDENE